MLHWKCCITWRANIFQNELCPKLTQGHRDVSQILVFRSLYLARWYPHWLKVGSLMCSERKKNTDRLPVSAVDNHTRGQRWNRKEWTRGVRIWSVKFTMSQLHRLSTIIFYIGYSDTHNFADCVPQLTLTVKVPSQLNNFEDHFRRQDHV